MKWQLTLRLQTFEVKTTAKAMQEPTKAMSLYVYWDSFVEAMVSWKAYEVVLCVSIFCWIVLYLDAGMGPYWSVASIHRL